MPDDRPASSKAGSYCITAIDKERKVAALAAGLEFRQANDLKKAMQHRFPDTTFIVEPDRGLSPHAYLQPVYQIVGVNEDCSRTPLMAGMTLQEAEAARDELIQFGDHIWVWIEREPG